MLAEVSEQVSSFLDQSLAFVLPSHTSHSLLTTLVLMNVLFDLKWENRSFIPEFYFLQIIIVKIYKKFMLHLFFFQ